jgi:ABC-type multidrug transport system ATPase subunit
MKIWHVKDVKVGGKNMKGLSGGEKRRTCIAAQLLLDASIISLILIYINLSIPY